MKKIIIYNEEMIFINGIVTWTMNVCKNLKDIYNITVLSNKWSSKVRSQFDLMVNTNIYKDDEIFECDTLLSSFNFKDIPSNIKYEKNYVILHCNYGEMAFDYKFNPNYNYIAVSRLAAEGFEKVHGMECNYIEGIFDNITLPRKNILKLISCTRMLTWKGSERMYKLEDELRRNNIKYRWENYCDLDILSIDTINKHKNSSIVPLRALDHDTLLDYISEADYLVQLSDTEGFCFAVHEALSVGTPVITTDIPAFELVQNEYNGYKLPLDMKEIPINKIVNNIPTNFTYESKYDEIKSKWCSLL